MKRTKIFYTGMVWLLLVLFCSTAVAQVVIKGTVYDKQARYGVPHVSVLSSSGVGTMTDTSGRYSIKVPENDSIYFSYLGKTTEKFPVKRMPPDQPLDISLPVSVDMLQSVTVHQPSYRMDSIANRKEYQKVFDYDGVAIGQSSSFGIGVSFDLIFNARKYKSMEKLKARLEREERDKYVDHRFTKALVRRITGLTSPALDSFMVEWRPSYDMLKAFETEYDYYKHIKTCGSYFASEWQRTHPGVPVVDSTFGINSSN